MRTCPAILKGSSGIFSACCDQSHVQGCVSKCNTAGAGIRPRKQSDWKNARKVFLDSDQVLPPRGTTTRRFVGHTKDVLSVAFSSDNRQIVSGSRDKTIKLWNTLGHANILSKMRATQNGCLVSVSHSTAAIPSSSPVAGTSWSRYGSWQTAS